MEENEEVPRTRTCLKKATFRVGQNVPFNKVEMSFGKVAKQNFSTEILKVAIAYDRRPRVFYELEDLNGTHIDGQFYREELTTYE